MHKRIIYLIALMLSFVGTAYAQDNFTIDNSTINTDNETSDNVSYANDNVSDFFSGDDYFELEDMEITEQVLAGENVGKTELPRIYIENMPQGNGGITDLLRAVPSVQYDEGYRGVSNAGEIAPAEVSISGGKAYDNLFLIDGISNSSILDPAAGNPYSSDDVSSNAQKFNIDSWIIEDITVYDSNVPTKYDGFTGGVVEVDTKRPGEELSGNISYRTTTSDMTYFHLNDNVTESPEFDKHFISASFNVPVTDYFGILASYKRTMSSIPNEYFNSFRTETRLAETYYLKSNYNIDGLSYIDVSLSYSPNSDKYYIHNTENSEFTIESGGYLGQVSYTRETGLGGILSSSLNYSYNENTRNAPNSFYSWVPTNYKPWGKYSASGTASSEGGWGSIEKYETSVNFNLDNKHDDLLFLGTHKVNYGLSYEYIVGREHRTEDAYLYDEIVVSADVNVYPDTEGASPGQYFKKRTVTPESDTTVSLNRVALYFEDKFDFYRFSLRAGIRGTYDDYMNNINFSPRTEFQYDIFDDLYTVFSFGYNRYYSATLLTYGLREGREKTYEEARSMYNYELQEWQSTASNATAIYDYESLKTPYNDELMVSVDQTLFSGILNVKYVERFGGDIFASERYVDSKGHVNHKLNNNGSSRYTGVTVKWSRSWQNHYFMVNTGWQQSNSSNNTYDESLDLEDLEDEVLFNGQVIKAYELPTDNFNRPIVVNVGYVGVFLKNLYFSTNVKFTSGYRQNEAVSDYIISEAGTDDDTGLPAYNAIPAYETVEYDPNITVDVAVEWRQPLSWGDKLIITAEVNNLFNTKNQIGINSSVSSYELGTQLWLGATYEF